MANHIDPARRNRLNKIFNDVLRGKQKLTAQNNVHFLEAICAQSDAAACVNSIISLPAGLDSIQESMRFDLTAKFFNGRATELLTYLQTPTLANIGGGAFLHQVILKIVEPDIFWTQFALAFRTAQLQDNAQRCFAWVLLHMMSATSDLSNPYLDLARDSTILDRILSSPTPETNALGQQIKDFLDMRSTTTSFQGALLPGGRHDNDFDDFRAIAILPTADEITCTKSSFLRSSSELDDPATIDTRLSIYLDSQFRLLREDMLYEMKEELQIALNGKKGRHRGMIIEGFKLLGIHCGPDERRRSKWGITLQCNKDLPFFDKIKPNERKAHLESNSRKILKHQSLTCLVVDGDLVAFPTINRDEELLSQTPPILVLQVDGDATTSKVLLRLKAAKDIKLVQIDTAVFAFEPVLKALQEAKTMPLSPELLFWTPDDILRSPSSSPTSIINALISNPRCDVGKLLGTPKSIILDSSQAASLLSALKQKVSLIQGPPGTGKSFIGALLAKALVDFTDQTVLVVCYTNHALDQFLEDLVNIGISEYSMVRLGKANSKTEAMSLQNQTAVFKRTRADWTEIDALRTRSEGLCSNLRMAFGHYASSSLSNSAILDYLEFEDPQFYEAFLAPSSEDGDMTVVGKNGQAIQRDYLLHQWAQGRDAGVLKQHPSVLESPDIWRMRPPARKSKLKDWKQAILEEQVEQIVNIAREYNETQTELARKFTANTVAVLQSKRIIGCTTTAAAKYTESIQAASPGVLLVEEAGEILESHVLTALGQTTDQLILIGDHQQLRPKVNNYSLTVEKGDGYDLNKSLFERLVLKGYPHKTLTQQHRMRPEISDLVRQLTYPDLIDAGSTHNRPRIRGLRDVIVFIDHACPEDELSDVSDRRDMGSSSSKQNTFEIEMVLKIVKYLGQQGYGTDDLVILTPYLGQLSLLKTSLAKENDPLLNDLDSQELFRAGLLPPQGSSRTHNRTIRLATIDNYQGEESDIVVVSLTRSNPNHDIGFMFSPERLNVLLSRARNSLIMIGNATTFQGARKGKALWTKLITMLQTNGHFYAGLPVHCERHPDHTAVLSRPVDFETECQDGGCQEPCGALLKCGHPCPSKCHQIVDHSKMPCRQSITWKCEKGHDQSQECRLYSKSPNRCNKCANDAKKAQAKSKREAEQFERKQRQEAEQLAHEEHMAEINAKIAREEQVQQDARLAEERAYALKQKQKDLQDAATRARQPQSPPPTLYQGFQSATSSPGPSLSTPTATPPQNTSSRPPDPKSTAKPGPSAPTPKGPPSTSQDEWERQKRVEGASNDAMDSIMGMIGLEDVKSQVLRIKHKIDVVKRQNARLNDERFNIVLQGNPGTGKTTVARHYAKFLASVGVIPGTLFIETTGSLLSHEGVNGIRGHIEKVENAGGGAIFIDEAYQLTSGYGQGNQVLDYLLAEMENKVGVIVFIFAGYKKELESFFEHNPGLVSRVPYNLSFADYTDEELLRMLEQLIGKKFNGSMKIEDGPRGLYARIAVRRLGRGRNTNGFGNARALHNLFAKVHERQAARLQMERKDRWISDDFLLTKEDLIGPDPSLASIGSPAWKKLQSMIGLEAVKDTVRNLIDHIIVNYQRELQEKEPLSTSLHRVFLGSPGTGKTTVARLYGEILADLGLLSKGGVVLKNPADFIGAHLGHSEKNTKAILATTLGKVLVIDEAYMLYSSGKHGIGNESDSFKTAVIDTLVAEIQPEPGEDRAVLLLGYEDKMVDMFQVCSIRIEDISYHISFNFVFIKNVNPGLSSRFAIEDAFRFEDFTDSQLREILDQKLKNKDLKATDPAKIVALEVLSRARHRPNFGNARDVENLLSQAKLRHTARSRTLPPQDRPVEIVFEPRDFDADFDRGANASVNLAKMFKDIVGCDHIMEKLGDYQRIAVVTKERGMDPRLLIPMNFVFKGPPGTGKTTIARKMGQIYYDMGFLSTKEVEECSASDLVGQYIGHTGPKTKQLFEKALGKVLFIDEAYRLGEGRFAQEAIDEIVGILTHPKFQNKVLVILAGYDHDMNSLMAINTGLSSRFPEEIIFHNMDPDACLEVLKGALGKQTIMLRDLDDKTSPGYRTMSEIIDKLSKLPSWGNARDMQTLAKQMATKVLTGVANSLVKTFWKDAPLVLPSQDAIKCMEAMLHERRSRVVNVKSATARESWLHAQPSAALGGHASPPPPSASSSSTSNTAQPPPTSTQPPPDSSASPAKAVPVTNSGIQRDAGISDAVWQQLQADIRAAQAEKKRREEAIQKAEQSLREAAAREQERIAEAQRLEAEAQRLEAQARDQAAKDEMKRKLEEIRIAECLAREERERRARELEAQRKAQELEQKREAKAQAALRNMGVCVAGFRWIKQAGGYRCAGGSHFINDAQLGMQTGRNLDRQEGTRRR
ncbi:P-loop containing nucleoside triphosphate hydrolase protein [Mycena maculata]|uniref:P-loop containing nucleoside triphosphate hydrolase protein n=1 Tax=Mycena maculata TaxID=230809 RepID=A0AAD7NDS7_9AGAR|nr:P-loop containing nucleoside triphosphate hydrolase protein [Mycena maculata]